MTFKNQTEIAIEDKAGYNQAGEIARTLSNLRNSYITAMLEEDYKSALKFCRRVVDLISAKVEEEKIKDVDKKIKEVKLKIPTAILTYVSGGAVYIKNPEARENCEILLEKIWRILEKLQDEYGYGMFSEDDSGL